MKLAFADREAYYGDPRHVTVPADGLLDPAYAPARARLSTTSRAWPEMPPPGDPAGAWRDPAPGWTGPARPAPPADARHLLCRGRGPRRQRVLGHSQRRVPHRHPGRSRHGPRGLLARLSVVARCPGIRALSLPASDPVSRRARAWCSVDGRLVMPFGTPGGDVQPQAMLQVLLNLVVFGMSPQHAVEAPRFATQSFPNSFWPHRYLPGRAHARRAHLRRRPPRRSPTAATRSSDGRTGNGRRAACAWSRSTTAASLGRRRPAPRFLRRRLVGAAARRRRRSPRRSWPSLRRAARRVSWPPDRWRPARSRRRGRRSAPDRPTASGRRRSSRASGNGRGGRAGRDAGSTTGSTSARPPGRPCSPPPTAPSRAPALTRTPGGWWSSPTTATSPPCTGTCRRSRCVPARPCGAARGSGASGMTGNATTPHLHFGVCRRLGQCGSESRPAGTTRRATGSRGQRASPPTARTAAPVAASPTPCPAPARVGGRARARPAGQARVARAITPRPLRRLS